MTNRVVWNGTTVLNFSKEDPLGERGLTGFAYCWSLPLKYRGREHPLFFNLSNVALLGEGPS